MTINHITNATEIPTESPSAVSVSGYKSLDYVTIRSP